MASSGERDPRRSDKQMTIGAAHLPVVVSFANLAINSVIICNSAAAAAALGFIAAVWGKDEFQPAVETAAEAVLIFTAGATFGMASACTAYIAQVLFQRSDQAKTGSKEETRSYSRGECWERTSMVLVVLGILAFPGGAWHGLSALYAALAVPEISGGGR